VATFATGQIHKHASELDFAPTRPARLWPPLGMGLYFFHLDGPHAARDDEGEEFPTLAKAIEAGRDTARELARNRGDSELAGWALRVSDETGLEVARFTISDFNGTLV
jgi:hypothetical protein